jgi:hypothetical protein
LKSDKSPSQILDFGFEMGFCPISQSSPYARSQEIHLTLKRL